MPVTLSCHAVLSRCLQTEVPDSIPTRGNFGYCTGPGFEPRWRHFSCVGNVRSRDSNPGLPASNLRLHDALPASYLYTTVLPVHTLTVKLLTP